MAAYYHHHHHHGTTQIPDHLHHNTVILMNPNFPVTGYPDPHALPPPPLPTLHHHQESVTLYGYPQPEARDITCSRQGLSLSLSSQTPPYGFPQPKADVAGGPQRSVSGSKYLKATQELLEEVVHIGDGSMLSTNNESPNKRGGGDGGGGGGGAQLNSAERQELQMKKAKLINMLDEAEQRYRQYHTQIQIVITWFDQAAGFGSSKTYTALALKTISKQFRCLKDAIQAQVKSANKSLGEGGELLGSSSTAKIEGSRLKYIDHQIRQEKSMQQFGMIQNHNAWRPQRGLPEKSVSVLRAWLFEHFLHPYPKDSDKTMLAKQAGLTRSQVSNWFINARVRLWKPMIEEMYTEENKEKEHKLSVDKTSSKENSIESNSATDQEKKINISDQKPVVSSSSSPSFIPVPIPIPIPIPTMSFKGNNNNTLHQNQHGFAFTGLQETEGISQGSPKRLRNNQILQCGESNREVLIGFGNDKQGKDNGYSLIPAAMNFVGGGEELESYPTIGEIGRFGTQEFPPTTSFLPGNGNGNGNGISLSLGLPPSENHTFLSPNHNIQFRRANDFGSLLNCCQTL